jgi:heme/copper-type cytochrome/quinol oxidase subunit 3
LTGFHGAHVTGGVLWILGVTIAAFLRPSRYIKNPIGLEVLGLYWHFVDLVWIILFTIVYLI